MSHLFISNSKYFSWRRIAFDIIAVLVILFALEAVVRVPPIHQYLAKKLDSYENLLWYDGHPPIYINDLKQDPDYILWFLGSSYMMTSIEPHQVEAQVSMALDKPITAQNFGLTNMTNLHLLADYYERVLFPLDKPEYMVLFITEGNFFNPTKASGTTGNYEQVFVYPDSISDHAGGWLYRNSQLYHYLILARNTSIISYEQTLREPHKLGGYTERSGTFDCQFNQLHVLTDAKMERGWNNLLGFINMAKRNDVPLLVINLPLPICTIELNHANFVDYQQHYLAPTRELVEAQGIPFYELDSRFDKTIQTEEQNFYFDDGVHANIDGSNLFSEWSAEIIAEWLSSVKEIEE